MLNPQPLEAPACPVYSVVLPVYNESGSIEHCIQRLIAVMESLGQSFELVFVDDGSLDQSFSILEKHVKQDKRIHVVSLSRNFGHQAALVAGLEHASGQAVISMDADLQHPPELIPEMLKLWREGNMVVYTIKQAAESVSPLRRLAMKVAYALIRATTGLEISFGQSDFRLLDRVVVDELIRMSERRKWLRGLVSWVGFKQAAIPYTPAARYAGTPKYSYKKLFQLAFDGIFSFSVLPLRATLVVGFLAASLALFYALFSFVVVVSAWYGGSSSQVPPGWLSIIMVVLFLGGIQLISIGLVGEYLGRVFEEVQHRPVYVVRRRLGFDRKDTRE